MKTAKHALLLSIRPRFAQQIFAGTKTVELRRVCPKVARGNLVLVYESSPTKKLRGAFEVSGVISKSPTALWNKVGHKSGVTRKEFFDYFKGKRIAHAIVIARAWELPNPICLTTLRQRHGGFRPPQNFHYLRNNELLTSSPAPSSPRNN